jgi:hypothetical protein
MDYVKMMMAGLCRKLVPTCMQVTYAGLILAMFAAVTPLHAAVAQSERNALIDLYNATQGSQWTNRAGWNGAAGTECYWAGVTCDAAQATVVSLSLANNNLHGTLTALTPFTNLTLFDVSQNVLTGSIPPLTGLSKLQVFKVWSNQLSGPLPSLSGLTALQELRVWSNQLTGAVPSLSGATNLTYFDAQSNQLSGTIPALAQLTGLQELIVSNNQLSGTMPDLTGLASLRKLDVSFNHLTGPVAGLSTNSSLQTLYIDHNNFSGSLPAAPSSLAVAALCPNALLSHVSDATWDTLSGKSPWYQNCGGPAKLAITSVNNGVNPAVGAKFSVVVVAQDTNGQAALVASYTTVQLSVVQGSGQLYSQSYGLQCTIPTGGSSCTASDVSYSIAESTVQIQATVPYYYYSDPVLGAGTSVPFSVVAGTYTVGGTVSGLAGSGLVLSLYPGSQRMAITANGAFTFPLAMGDGAYYSANVVSSPTSPLQQCAVQGSGSSGNIAGSNITGIQVTCITLRTLTVNAGPNGNASPGSETINSGSTGYIYVYANLGFYPQVSAHGCTVTRNGPNSWTTDALFSDCTVSVIFVATQFVSVTPVRLLDTRPGRTTIDGNYAGTGPLAANVPFAFSVLGRGTVPSTGVAAVVLNVTATNTSAPGFFTLWPSCHAQPVASNLNFVGAQTVANLVIVAAGCDATANLLSSTGPTDAIADVVGYFRAGPDITPLVPARLLDTRAGAPTVDGLDSGTGKVSGGNQFDLQVTSRAGIPSPGAAAVAVNITATNPSAASYVTVWPTDQARPLASNLNFIAGQTVPNLVISKLSANGKISLFNAFGTTDLIADVTAWFPTSSDLVPITPARLMDTRAGAGTVDGLYSGNGPVVSSRVTQFQVAGRGGVPSYGVNAVVLNVTATNPSTAGYLTVWSQSDYTQPLTSNLNFVAGQTVPNLVIVKVGYYSSYVNLSVSGGNTDVVIDVVGWLVGP